MNIHHRCHDVTVAASEILPSAIEIVTELSLLKGNSWSIPTARVLSIPHYILKGSLVDPRLRTSNDIDDPSKLAYLSFTGGWPVWPPTARGFHTRPPTGTPRRAINPASTFPSCAFREHRRPTDTHIPSLSSNPPSPLRGVAEAALYCAHRTIYMFPPSSLVLPLLEGHIHVGLRAAVERGPSQGARSGSTGPTWVSFLFFIVQGARAQKTI